jgi:ribosomal protein S18 acetylase RimI-like enzyme
MYTQKASKPFTPSSVLSKLQLARIGVLEPSRRKDIGTRLVLQGLKTLKTKSMVKAMVDTEDNNPTKAIKLYEKVGFKVGQDCLTYEKSL